MLIRLLYFAAIRELMGKEDEEVSLPADVRDVSALRRWIERTREPLRGRLAGVRFARNEAFALEDELLASGDVVALIPPVAGG